jgi:hypothetical protein
MPRVLELFHFRPERSSLRHRLFNAFAYLDCLINTNQIENKNADSFRSLDEKASAGKISPPVQENVRRHTSANFLGFELPEISSLSRVIARIFGSWPLEGTAGQADTYSN